VNLNSLLYRFLAALKPQLLSFLGLTLIAVPAWAQNNATSPLVQKLSTSGVAIHALAVGARPVVDGLRDASVYASGIRVDINTEHQPGTNVLAPVQTVGWIARDADALYVFIRSQIPAEGLRANTTRRDEAFEDDFVGIALDPYADTRNMLFLGANAYGIQLDLRKNNPADLNNNFDVSYDLLYDAAAVRTDTAYSVELRIPFSSLPFPSGKTQVWKFALFRNLWVGAQNHTVNSYPIDRNNVCSDCQYDDALLMDGLKQPRKFQVLPYALGGLVDPPQATGAALGKVGGSFLAGFGSETVVEGVYNPDFSQVESDALQIGVNSSYALFYPERRPFFNEGADLLATRGNLIYSRTVADPLLVTKAVHQGRDIRAYALAGYDRSSPYLVPGEDNSYLGRATGNTFGIFRTTKPFEKAQFAGLMGTHRRYDAGGSGSLLGTDFNARLSPTVRLFGEGALSLTQEPNAPWISNQAGMFGNRTKALDGEQFMGYFGTLEVQKVTERWMLRAMTSHVGRDFRAEMGFRPSVDRRRAEVGGNFRAFPNGKWIKNYGVYYEVFGEQTVGGKTKQTGWMADSWMQLAGSINLSLGHYYRFMEEFKGSTFRWMPYTWGSVSYNPRQWLMLSYRTDFGQGLTRNADFVRAGDERNGGFSAQFQLAGKIRWTLGINHAQMRERDGSGSLIYRGYVARSVVHWGISKAWSSRVVLQYDDFGKGWTVQPLVQYQPSPFTLIYTGASLTPWDRSVFAKVQYQFEAFKSRKSQK